MILVKFFEQIIIIILYSKFRLRFVDYAGNTHSREQYVSW